MKHKCWVTLVAVCCAFCVSLPGLARGQPSLLLDGNLKAGYQALDGLVGVQPGQRVAVEIYGKGIEGISGFSANITFDAAQLSFDGFEAGQVIPGFTGLQTAVGSGSVSVGGASVSGVSGAAEGRLGVVYFNTSTGFSGNASVTVESGKISTGPASSSVGGGARVVVGVAVTGQIILDADLAPGIQAARNVVGVTVGDVIAIEVQGNDITGVSGFSATLKYDAGQMAFVDFSATTLIPGMTGLAVESSGSVEIGAASVDGVSPVAGGQLGVVRFQLLSGYTGSATIKLTNGRVSTGGVASTFQSSQVINVGKALGPMALDLNLAAGDQKRRQTTAVPKAGDEVVIDIVAISGAQGKIGFQAVLKYDPAQLEYTSFEPKDLFATATTLPGNPPDGTVAINVAILGGTASSDAGSMGHVTFTVLSGFTGETTVRLSSGQYDTTPVQIGSGGATVTIGGQGVKTPDLDGNGKVGFSDFLIFARGFGKSEGEAGFDARMDYDDSGKIDFPDFLFFAQNFGKTVGG